MRILLSIVTITTLFLSGCTTPASRLNKYVPYQHELETEALVIISTNNTDYLDLCRYDTISKKTNDSYRIYRQPMFFNLASYASNIYTIEPGYYYICSAYYDGTSASNNSPGPFITRKPGISKQGKIEYGAFAVKAGQVLFVGTLDFNWVNSTKPNFITVTGSIGDAKQDLIDAGYKNISSKIEPVKFYNHGTSITSIN